MAIGVLCRIGAVDVSCLPPSGSAFGVKETVVNCTAADAQGNGATGSFTVKVVDTTKPVLNLPDDITTEGTSLGGALVDYTATAADIVDGAIDPVCEPKSGSIFRWEAPRLTARPSTRPATPTRVPSPSR